MSTGQPEVEFLSDPEIEARIDRICREHPGLREFAPPSTCCSGCKEKDVAEALGHPAARAWRSVDAYRWMLGGA